MQKKKINEGTRPPGEDTSMFFLHAEELTVYFITILVISRSTDWYDIFGRKYFGVHKFVLLQPETLQLF